MTSTEVKTRGIPFSGWKASYVAGLEIGAEFQTRRPTKEQPPEGELTVGIYHPTKADRHGEEYPGEPIYGAYTLDGDWTLKSPYGQPGDRLYSRETWRPTSVYPDNGQVRFDYKAGGRSYADGVENWGKYLLCEEGGPWRAGRFQPKWASRGLFEILSVKVERVKDISEEDAKAEGVAPIDLYCPEEQYYPPGTMSYREGFCKAWDEMYAKQPEKQWASNPWLWCYTLKKLANGVADG